MAEKVSIRSQIAAVETAIKANALTPEQKRFLKGQLEAAAQTLRFVAQHEAQIRALSKGARR